MDHIERNRAAIAAAEGKAVTNLLPTVHLNAAVQEARDACKAHGVPAAGLVIEVTCAGADTGTPRYPKKSTYATVRIGARSYTVERAWRGIARAPKQHWRILGAGYSSRETDTRLAQIRRGA